MHDYDPDYCPDDCSEAIHVDPAAVQSDHEWLEGVRARLEPVSDEPLAQMFSSWQDEVGELYDEGLWGEEDPAVTDWRAAMRAAGKRRSRRRWIAEHTIFPVIRLLARIPWPHPKSW